MEQRRTRAAGTRSDAPDGVRHELRVGPAGWAYKDWNGVVYPSPRPKGFHEATFLAQFFDTIEINTSFYRPLRIEQAEQWVERVASNPRFMFTAKLWQRFTHDSDASPSDEREVRMGFDVLMGEAKLGAVLVQFPFAFHRTRETVTHLTALLRRFAQYPLVVEFRHASWNAPETFALLRDHRAGFCNIDQPIIGRSLEPSAEVTSEIGYVRLHGRRYDTWFKNSKSPTPRKVYDASESAGRRDFFPQNDSAATEVQAQNNVVAIPAFERYNYLYSEAELLPWAARVQAVSATTKSTYVMTNNHYLGKGVVNALQLISILKGAKLAIPEPLRERYPALNEIAVQPPEAPTLFPMG
jgi:uncharacterized protein YecE (DUF72 family)